MKLIHAAEGVFFFSLPVIAQKLIEEYEKGLVKTCRGATRKPPLSHGSSQTFHGSKKNKNPLSLSLSLFFLFFVFSPNVYCGFDRRKRSTGQRQAWRRRWRWRMRSSNPSSTIRASSLWISWPLRVSGYFLCASIPFTSPVSDCSSLCTDDAFDSSPIFTGGKRKGTTDASVSENCNFFF